jgi:hypothetical protein
MTRQVDRNHGLLSEAEIMIVPRSYVKGQFSHSFVSPLQPILNSNRLLIIINED